ncbi:response regulator [Magnetococcales bacterium HHB-1]
MKTLIVDDKFEYRKMLRDLLQPFGSCDMASNGRDAMQLFRADLNENQPYDLVFLDILMPVMDGQTTLHKMRALERKQGIPSTEESVIIMLTSMDSNLQAMQAYFKGGCTDYMKKPITRESLLVKLEEHDLIEV